MIRHVWAEKRNRVTNALRIAAEALTPGLLRGSLSILARPTRGPKAIKARARYLACLVYRMLMKEQDWVDHGAAYYEQRRQQRELMHLERRAEAGARLALAFARKNPVAFPFALWRRLSAPSPTRLTCFHCYVGCVSFGFRESSCAVHPLACGFNGRTP